MQETRWAQAWMTVGLLWFLLAIAIAPTNKLYQQGLVVFLWLPAIMLCWSARARLRELFHEQRWVYLPLLGLVVWSLLSLSWSNDADPGRAAKRLLYIVVFLLFFPVFANARPERVIRVMQWGGIGLAVDGAGGDRQILWNAMATSGFHAWKGWANCPIRSWAATSSGWQPCGWCSGHRVRA